MRNPEGSSHTSRPGHRAQWIAKQAFFFALLAACLFVPSGRLSWPAAWVYLAVIASIGATMSVVLARRSPDLIEERSRIGEGTKRWDIALAAFTAFSPMLMALAAGIQKRFEPAPFAVAPVITGILGVFLGSLLTLRAMMANRFFSGVVRIQKERDHKAVTDGPYRYVRHPGYLGALLFTLAAPLILGAEWAFAPAAATVTVLLVRTALEDRTLRKELAGYSQYADRVRYRLVPFLW